MSNIRNTAARLFKEASDITAGGLVVNRARIAVTGLGSELGEETVAKACRQAVSEGYCIHYLGTKSIEGAVNVKCSDEGTCSSEMAGLLEGGQCDAAVTMHHAFPIGTATVGRVVTPSRGKEMFIATTTGTPATDRIQSMVLGAIYGIITAKSCGVKNPTLGILNIDGARRAETILQKLKDAGFPIEFAKSARADGGAVMRGNDALLGTADILACDPLTGNVLMKMLSAYQSGGDRECLGYGYGPGIGKDARHPILIVSRASDTPVIFNAVRYAAKLTNGSVIKNTAQMLALAEKCGLESLFSDRPTQVEQSCQILPPKREVVSAEIAGIEVTDIEDAVTHLWKNDIYAEGGMGCTGPVVMVNERNLEKARAFLREGRYIEE